MQCMQNLNKYSLWSGCSWQGNTWQGNSIWYWGNVSWQLELAEEYSWRVSWITIWVKLEVLCDGRMSSTVPWALGLAAYMSEANLKKGGWKSLSLLDPRARDPPMIKCGCWLKSWPVLLIARLFRSCLTRQNVPYSCDSRIMELPIASWSGLLESGEDWYKSCNLVYLRCHWPLTSWNVQYLPLGIQADSRNSSLRCIRVLPAGLNTIWLF